MEATYEPRFWGNIKLQESGCMEWQKYRDKKGYGAVKRSGTAYLAHREAWRLTYGALEDSVCVLHRCDNPPCCNPDHLFLGSRADNIRDMISKGRDVHFSGEDNANSKLTDSQVVEIREMYKTGAYRQEDLAKMFHVDQTHVSRIVRGEVR